MAAFDMQLGHLIVVGKDSVNALRFYLVEGVSVAV